MKKHRRRQTSAFALIGLAAAGVIAGLGLGATGAAAQGYGGLSCGQLWYERNAIFAEHGHCFTTPQGIATFGRRCHPPYGRLSPWAQARVNEIIAWERRKGCR